VTDALAHGERGEIEGRSSLCPGLDGHVVRASLLSSRTCSPSRSRCAPSATTRSLRLERRRPTAAASSAEAGDLHGTPGDPGRFPSRPARRRPLTRIEDRAVSGTCSAGTRPAVRTWMAMVEPSGAVCQPALQQRTGLERSGSGDLPRPTTGAASQGPSARSHTARPSRGPDGRHAGFRGGRWTGLARPRHAPRARPPGRPARPAPAPQGLDAQTV
jgi:hypothetical protein